MTPEKDWKIYLADLAYDEAEEKAVQEVIRSRWLSMGPRTEEFERRVCEMVGADYAVCVSSCTAGLYLLLAALDIGPGDEVLVPSLTFVATANVILHRGATPIFCDIVSPELPLIDPAEIARNLSSSTKAIYTVDYAGFPCDYDAIAVAIAELEAEFPGMEPGNRHRVIHLLEDAAHGIGGALDEQRQLGNCGDAGVFSFFSNKNVATGEGGMVVTNQSSIAEKVRLMRRHGLTSSTWERHLGGELTYDVTMPGWNFRPTEIMAALGLAQIDKLEMHQWRRQSLVRRYFAAFAEIEEICVPFACDSTWHMPACHVMPILLPDSETRDRVREALRIRGVQTSHHYPPIHLFEYYQQEVPSASVSLPNTEEYARRELTVPLHPNMSPEDIDYIVAGVKEGLAR